MTKILFFSNFNYEKEIVITYIAIRAKLLLTRSAVLPHWISRIYPHTGSAVLFSISPSRFLTFKIFFPPMYLSILRN